MKKLKVTNYKYVSHLNEDGIRTIYLDGDEDMQVSDGFHTMDELYEHRITLWIALCRISDRQDKAIMPSGTGFVWRSKKHSDGEMAFGGTWFVLGIGQAEGHQMTYHLPIEKWDECSFAEELETAPEWDGHTPADVIERIKKYI